MISNKGALALVSRLKPVPLFQRLSDDVTKQFAIRFTTLAIRIRIAEMFKTCGWDGHGNCAVEGSSPPTREKCAQLVGRLNELLTSLPPRSDCDDGGELEGEDMGQVPGHGIETTPPSTVTRPVTSKRPHQTWANVARRQPVVTATRNNNRKDNKSGWVNVEITFRPDRGLQQPAGCKWLERVVLPIRLGWSTGQLCRALEGAVKRALSSRAGSTFDTSKISRLQVWGVRALDSGVVVPKSMRGGVQLRDRDQPQKVDMSWETFTGKLYANKRVTAPGTTAFTLYLAYDYGISLHRDLRGKPRALVGN